MVNTAMHLITVRWAQAYTGWGGKPGDGKELTLC